LFTAFYDNASGLEIHVAIGAENLSRPEGSRKPDANISLVFSSGANDGNDLD
jgi:hypothetical protein